MKRRLSKFKQFLYSTGIVVLVSIICYAFSGIMGYRVTALVLLLTVSLIAISFEILPVLFSALLSALIWDFFFIPPKFTIHVDTTEDAILLTMYFVIAMINGVLTYRIRLIENKARVEEERARSVKLYNTILNSLSHELRTPIAAIIGAADNLQGNRNLLPEEKEQLVSEISRAGIRLNQQVENLLNISRLESGHIKPKSDWCDVVELIYDVVDRVEENNPRRKIHISVRPDLPLCYTDKGMLDQIVYNLLNNAAVHTAENCRIDIMVSCHTDLLEIIVQDNGQGFGNVDLKDIFDKFSRERKAETAGSGLGLSIVKGFTDALGGSVVAERIKEDGTRFTLTLPVKTSDFKHYQE